VNRTRTARMVAVAVAVCGGVAMGEAAWRGGVRHRSAEPPTGWSMDPGQTPYQLADIAGTVEMAPDRWSLGYYRTVRPLAPHVREAPMPVSGVVTLPVDGLLEVWLAAPRDLDRGRGIGLVLDRVGTPSARVFEQSQRGAVDVECDAPLVLPDAESFPFSIRPDGAGVVAEVGDTRTRCRAAARTGGPALRPGLRTVQVESLRVGEIGVPAPGPALRPLWWIAGALLAVGAVGLELWLGARLALVLLTTAPLLAALPLAGVDFRVWAETARVTWLPVAWLGAVLPGLVAVAAKLTHLAGRALREPPDTPRRDWPAAGPIAASLPVALAFATEPGGMSPALAAGAALVGCGLVGAVLPHALRLLGGAEPRRAATLVVSAGAVCAGILAIVDTEHRGAIIGGAMATTAWALLVWVQANASRIRAYNLASLAAVCLGLYGLEGAVRGTRAGVQWSAQGARTQADDIYGWVQQATEDFALMDDGQHRDYPDRGYPTAYVARGDRPRLVAMGGSTTGGAFQNDDLAEFYPALLEGRLERRFEVVNQGVGGWTTFHIRRYLDDHIDALDPDLLTLYVGHNDLLTPVPVPLSDLYAARAASPRFRAMSERLRSVLLYQGFRYLLTSLRPAGRRVAVPIDDAEQNIRAIVSAMRDRDGKVMLMSEGLSPDPTPLGAYNAMLARIAAESEDVTYVDMAGALYSSHGNRFFVDDCHLSQAGHRFVAHRMADHLEKEGLLDARP
jgi:lysophospholipase L1-like esterase